MRRPGIESLRSRELGDAFAPADVRRRASVLKNGGPRPFVAEADEGTWLRWGHVGKRETLLAPPQAKILGLVVATGGRGGGIGRARVGRGLRWVRESPSATVWVQSNTAHIGSHPFYRRLGVVCRKHSAVNSLSLRSNTALRRLLKSRDRFLRRA